VLGHLSYEGGLSQCLLTEIKEARFRKPVVPGDVVRYEVTVTKRRLPFFWFDAIAYVGDEIVANAKISALMK
jgi:3-hydroxyacyl-[acyl-carrier-protein] dehydratase